MNEQWAHMSLSMVVDDSHVWIVHNSLEVVVPAGVQVSLLPVGNEVAGVTTTGLQWPLSDESLLLGEGRGMSNRSIAKNVSIFIRSGVLLVFISQPE